MGAHLLEVLLALVAERLSDLRSVLQCRAHLLVLHVEDAERARGALLLRIVVEHALVRVEPRVQALDIRRAARAVADRVELELVARDAERAQERVVVLEHLGVDGRVGRADALEGELVVLPVTTALGSRIAVHRRDREELDRLRLAVHAVLDVRAADRRGALRTERERAPGAVLERVHLLLHDVGAGARRALKELRVLEARGLDAAVAVERAEALHLTRHLLPQRLIGGKDVVRAARCP